jgi:integrase/recombinase XerD
MNLITINIEQSIEDFKGYLLEKDRSKNTIKSYSQDLYFFLNWIYQRYDYQNSVTDITSVDIKDYERELKSNSLIAPTTINRRLVSLKQWTEFMSTYGYTPFNLGSNVKVKKIQRQNNIRWLTRKEVGRLLHAIELTKQENYLKGLFHQVVVYLMVNLGLRAQETCDLRISQIVQHRNIVNINGKGNKSRIVPLTENTNNLISLWIKERKRDSEYLLISSKSDKVTTRAIQHILKNYSELIGVDITPHTLRHTYCKQLADHGVDIQSIAELAGHNSIETTRVYVTPSIQELQEALKMTEF